MNGFFTMASAKKSPAIREIPMKFAVMASFVKDPKASADLPGQKAGVNSFPTSVPLLMTLYVDATISSMPMTAKGRWREYG